MRTLIGCWKRPASYVMTCSSATTLRVSTIALLLLGVGTTHASLQTSVPDGIQSAYGDVTACGGLENNDSVSGAVLHLQSTRSKLSCLVSCFRHGPCSHAVYVPPSDVSPASCLLLGGHGQTRQTREELRDQTCHILTMNPCHNGGSFVRGFCHCPDGFTGVRCELYNPDDCYNGWVKVYATDVEGHTTVGSKSAVAGISSPSLGGYIKVKLQLHNATLLAGGRGYHTFAAPFYSMQVSPTLSKKTWGVYKDVPARLLRLLKDDGSLYTVDEADGSMTQVMVAAEWFARAPHEPRLLHSFDATGKPLNGTLDDLLKALADGWEIVSYPAVKFDRAKRSVMLNRFGWELGVDNVTRTFVKPPYWFHSKLCACGRLEIVRILVMSETLHEYTSSHRVGRSLYADACWVKATTDRTGCEGSVAYLIAAVVNGHRVRLVVDGMALSVEQILVVGGRGSNTTSTNTTSSSKVVFDTAPFVEPVDSNTPLTHNPAAVRLAVGSDGRVVSCSRRLLPDWDTAKTSDHASRLTWFVHTRRWSRVFTITTEGEVRHGSESALVDAVTGGASVQLGLTMDHPASPSGAYLLLTVHTLHVSQSGQVVAEAEGLWNLITVHDLDCLSLALLVTSLGEVRMYSYRHRQPGSHSVGQNMTIDWFVDSFHLA